MFGRMTVRRRVAGVTKPAVKFEVWLPLDSWNGKFQGVGNGANAGSIVYPAMATALRRGYATASTDTGAACAPRARTAGRARANPSRVRAGRVEWTQTLSATPGRIARRLRSHCAAIPSVSG